MVSAIVALLGFIFAFFTPPIRRATALAWEPSSQPEEPVDVTVAP